MKLLELVRKDLRISLRDTKTLLLIVAMPLFVMLLLSVVFGAASRESAITGVNVGLCDLDDGRVEFEIPIFNIVQLDSRCEDAARILVERGVLRAAVVIPEGFSRRIEEGRGSEMVLFVDNAKGQTAIVVSNALRAYVQEANERIGVRFIEEAWKNLRELNEQLKLVSSNLGSARAEVVKLNEEISNMTGAVDERKIRRTLGRIGESVNRSEVLVKEALVLVRGVDLGMLKGGVDVVQGVYDENCVVNARVNPAVCLSLEKAVILLKESVSGVTSGMKGIETRLEEVLLLVAAEKNAVNDLLGSGEGNMTGRISALNATLVSYNSQLLSTIDQLEETTRVLDEYTSRDPRSVVAAVSLDEEFIHGEKSFFEILVPGLVSMLLLFVLLLVSSLNIVAERKSGTMARTLLSPTTIWLFLAGKAIYLLILAGVEVVVMLGVLFFTSKYLLLTQGVYSLLILVSLGFILLGIVIGCIARSENTALLLSLVVAIPMLFLSGLFFPFEIMPGFMKAVGTNLPLTLAIELLEKVLIYDAAVLVSSVGKLVLYCLFLFVIAFLLIKKNPTS